MCGIAGAFHPHGRVDLGRLRRMSQLLRHRGPDDEGVALIDVAGSRVLTLGGPDTPDAVSGSGLDYAPGRWWSAAGDGARPVSPADASFGLGLVNRRLAILDLSPAGHMPMCDAARAHWITYNGEIYNHVELREELQALGRTFRSGSDVEVVLAAYAQWGHDCLARFNGMFAFALWDVARRELFCARDRLGVKPFHYTWDHGAFAFASEPKALVHTAARAPRVRAEAVLDFVALDWVDHEWTTFFEGVASLPGGHFLVIGERGIELRPWWSLDPNRHATGTPEDWAAEFAERFTDAVRLRLRADVEVGACLSGGLDSSAVLTTAAPLAGRPLHAFTCAYDEGPAYDERPFVRAVVDRTGAVSHVAVPDGGDFWSVFERLTEAQDEPTAGAGLYSQWKVMELAHRAGLKVLLDGQGGDELQAGYGHYVPSRLRDLLIHGRGGEFARAFGRLSGQVGVASAWALTLEPWQPSGVFGPLRRRYGQGKDRVLAGPLRGRLDARQRALPRRSRAFPSQLSSHLAFDLVRRMLPSLLRYEDRNSMAFSIETRLPFLDYRLVEFAFSLPDDQRLDGATSKALLRRALADRIPPAVLQRRDKLGFATPSDAWLRGTHAREMRHRLLSPGPLHEWLDPAALESELDAYATGERPIGPQVWRWLSLESWLRRFVSDPQRTLRPSPVPARERGSQSRFEQASAPKWETAPGAASR